MNSFLMQIKFMLGDFSEEEENSWVFGEGMGDDGTCCGI